MIFTKIEVFDAPHGQDIQHSPDNSPEEYTRICREERSGSRKSNSSSHENRVKREACGPRLLAVAVLRGLSRRRDRSS